MYRRLKSPLLVQVELTERCGNSCLHCYNSWRAREAPYSRNGIDFPVEKIDAFVAELARYEIFHLVITGGEPLLNKRALFLLLQKAKEAQITVTINSSLTCLTDRDTHLFKELDVSSVLTSVLGSTSEKHDSITQIPGSFTKTLRGIKILQCSGVRVSANMVVSRKNLDDIRATANLVKSLGIRNFNATRVGCPGNCGDFRELELTPEEFRHYLDMFHSLGEIEGLHCDALEGYPLCGLGDIKKHIQFLGRKCLAGITTLTIAPNGSARPCSHLDVEYGNLFIDGLGYVWDKMAEWARGSFLPSTCRSCKLLSLCSGGCRMEAKMINGSLTALDPYAFPEEVERMSQQLQEIFASREEDHPYVPERFKLNPAARIHTEAFGIVVFIGIHKAGMYNQDAANLLAKLKGGSVYALADLLDPGLTEDRVSNTVRFFSKLYKRGIILGG